MAFCSEMWEGAVRLTAASKQRPSDLVKSAVTIFEEICAHEPPDDLQL